MKKIFTLIAVAAAALSVNAQNVVQWKAVVDGTAVTKGGEVIQVLDGENIVGNVAFGTTDNWTTGSGKANITYNDVEYSFTEYFTTSSTNGNGGEALKADGSDPYNYVAFVPNYSGTFILGLQNGGTKTRRSPSGPMRTASTRLAPSLATARSTSPTTATATSAPSTAAAQ